MIDLVDRDRRWLRAGGWYAHVGPSKRRASVNGVSQRRENQIKNADPKGVPQDFADWFANLAASDAVHAEAVIAGLLDELVRHTDLEDGEWRDEWIAACSVESENDVHVDLAQLNARTDPSASTLSNIARHAPRQIVGLLRLLVLAEARLEGARCPTR